MGARLAAVSSLLLATVAASSARAEVVAFDVRSRSPLGQSGYEKIIATARLAVDPQDSHNRIIADVDLAPRNAAGRVESSVDVMILRPLDPTRANGAAVVDVPNRGYPLILQQMDHAPGRFDFATDRDLGDGVLMARGFALVWIGWQFDVARNGRFIGADLPHANGISGRVEADFTPNERARPFAIADLVGYPPADPADVVLTVRDGPFGEQTTVPSNVYELRGNVLTVAEGFSPGRTYRIGYRTSNPAITGLGLAAIRDVGSWLRRSPESPLRLTAMYAYGVSQSGRFLRRFLRQGFNRDERDGEVFDAALIVGAGGAELDINRRWAQPNGNGFFVAAKPDAGLVDTVARLKVFHVFSGFEYWAAGRSAALTHTTPDGTADVAPPPNSRIYFFASSSHAPGPLPARVQNGAQPSNFVPFEIRALLVALDLWVRLGTEPPPSVFPHLSDGTLVPPERVGAPAVPGLRTPRDIPPARSDDVSLPLLVSQVDEDGIDRGGIRLPLIAVPLATYTGWNFRNAAIGGPTELFPFIGSFVPFAITKEARLAAGDPRRSIGERYASRAEYFEQVRKNTDALIADRYLLPEDAPRIALQAGQLWDAVVGSVPR
jgi:hypothetical protein